MAQVVLFMLDGLPNPMFYSSYSSYIYQDFGKKQTYYMHAKELVLLTEQRLGMSSYADNRATITKLNYSLELPMYLSRLFL